jgi:hypothetical protein
MVAIRRALHAICLAAMVGAAPVLADVWDLDPFNEDDSLDTDNQLIHGARQVHDLASQGGVADQDWYLFANAPYSSYEALIEGMTGTLFAGTLPVDHISSNGVTVLGSAQNGPGGLATSRSLRIVNAGPTSGLDFVRVLGSGAGCTTTCTTNDQYSIRFYETTAAIPRYNQSGTQVTVVILQSIVDGYQIDGTVRYWNGVGNLVASNVFTLLPRNTIVLATPPAANGTSGAITIDHNGRFGDLQGKGVALEPATGFSFDSPLIYRPQ